MSQSLNNKRKIIFVQSLDENNFSKSASIWTAGKYFFPLKTMMAAKIKKQINVFSSYFPVIEFQPVWYGHWMKLICLTRFEAQR